jgi:hypothetical protein
MLKRLMVVVVGAALGSLVGVVARFLGAGDAAVFGGAAVGAVLPLAVLGRPGR